MGTRRKAGSRRRFALARQDGAVFFEMGNSAQVGKGRLKEEG
jgi:hypothetical protein